jgi:hypothetical protein
VRRSLRGFVELVSVKGTVPKFDKEKSAEIIKQWKKNN